MARGPKIVISGGGTGGHIFPAVSIAKEIIKKYPDALIQFIGANGRMEMERIPEAGFPIHGINIAGFQRKSLFKNIGLPAKLISSLFAVFKFLKKTKPDAVIGTGGYVSGPSLFVAQLLGIPTMIQEQNSLAGWTNRILSRKAKIICVAYPKMERFFLEKKICLTGNPVRENIAKIESNSLHKHNSAKAKSLLGFNPELPLILVLGGSQGAKAINKSVQNNLKLWENKEIQILWQCGAYYIDELKGEISNSKYLKIEPFIKNMDKAYIAADIVVSRAGAGTISEICCAGCAAILIPSPNVAEDHQTQNAKSLVDQKAAIFIDEKKSESDLGLIVSELMINPDKLKYLRSNALNISKPNAAAEILNQLENHWLWKN
ncbi:MAG: undecaprenyldiphospho-muramoylpentapeptide beta-N-acetylglucosaminyltransferase [Schleiferiaceae bacterium]|nr:undecaprenyldiphospho-muramoylpentapeptide beta-N-acetylglucosaminyltransferase [Schleiferiaceae bacterium]